MKGIDEQGRKTFQYSYSKLQDDFYEHMQNAGFTDFERGQKGSDREHLEVVEFKTKAEIDRLAELILKTNQQKGLFEQYQRQVGTQKKLIKLSKRLDNMGQAIPLVNKTVLTNEEFKELKALARQGVEKADENIDLKAENDKLKNKVEGLQNNIKENANKRGIEYQVLQNKYYDLKDKYDELAEKVKPFMRAIEKAGEKLLDFIKNVLHLEAEPEQEKKPKQRDDFELEM